MAESMESSSSQAPSPQQTLFGDECWTTEETFTLLDALEIRYMELNGGKFRYEDWLEVAFAVNEHHGHTEETCFLAIECRNRIDALEIIYKIEKNRISQGDGTLTSSWPLFSRVEQVIGPNIIKHQNDKHTQSLTPLMSNQSMPPLCPTSPPLTAPFGPLHYWEPPSAMLKSAILPQIRPSTAVEESDYTRKYSLEAAAKDLVDGEEDEGKSEDEEAEGREDKGVEKVEGVEGLGRLAKAIERFVEVYEKVETVKQNQMVELEKERMSSAKDLELKWMQLLKDTLAQQEKTKQAKQSQ